MHLFLYDYTNMPSEIVVFGYTEEGRKCEVYLRGFSICCDVVVDPEYFESAVAMQLTLEKVEFQTAASGKKRCVKDLVVKWEQV